MVVKAASAIFPRSHSGSRYLWRERIYFPRVDLHNLNGQRRGSDPHPETHSKEPIPSRKNSSHPKKEHIPSQTNPSPYDFVRATIRLSIDNSFPIEIKQQCYVQRHFHYDIVVFYIRHGSSVQPYCEVKASCLCHCLEKVDGRADFMRIETSSMSQGKGTYSLTSPWRRSQLLDASATYYYRLKRRLLLPCACNVHHCALGGNTRTALMVTVT